MPQQTKGQAAPDFIPADGPDFIPADGSAGTQPAAAVPRQTTLQKIGSGLSDFAKGLGEGAVSTMSMGDDWARKHLPAFFTNSDLGFGKPADEAHVKELATPANATQAIGKGAEQVGEFFIPGPGEEAAAAKIAEYAPRAKTLAKIGTSAAGAGLINKLQGGSFTGGAAAGAAGATVGAGLKKIAPVIAETAMKVRGTDRAYGRTPGLSILDETTGVKPGKIAKQAGDKVAQYTAELDNAARNSEVPVDLEPARDTASSWYASADERNNDLTRNQLKKMGKQLDERNGQFIPRFVSAHEGLALRRGIDDLQTSWNPAITPDFSSRAVTATRNAFAPELENAIPEYKNLTGKISTLMPVEKRATAADLNAGFTQRALGRVGAHTGALVGAGIGAGAGYEKGGLPGAVMGLGAGIALPEIFASPEVQMGVARAAYSPATRRLFIPAAEGAGLQFSRNRDRD